MTVPQCAYLLLDFLLCVKAILMYGKDRSGGYGDDSYGVCPSRETVFQVVVAHYSTRALGVWTMTLLV